jgi:ribosomal protein L37AE/L43A
VVDAYPDAIKSAHITAMNERKLKSIEQTGKGIEQFMEEQENYIREHVSTVNGLTVTVVGPPEARSTKNKRSKKVGKRKTGNASSEHRCTKCGSGLVLRKAKETSFWGCSDFPNCRSTYQDRSGKPEL